MVSPGEWTDMQTGRAGDRTRNPATKAATTASFTEIGQVKSVPLLHERLTQQADGFLERCVFERQSLVMRTQRHLSRTETGLRQPLVTTTQEIKKTYIRDCHDVFTVHSETRC